MGRHRKYKSIKIFSASVEESTFHEIERMRGKLSRGEFIELLVTQKGEIAQILAENETLKRENQKLRELVEKYERRIDELESKLRTATAKEDKPTVKPEILELINKALGDKGETTLLKFMRALGYKQDAEGLKKEFEQLRTKHFEQDGERLISRSLGVVVELDKEGRWLASKVKRLEG